TVAFTAEAWAELAADRAGMADRLLEVAERALARAESPSGEHPVVSGGSRLEAHGLVKTYKGRRVVNDVSVRLEQGEIVGLLGPAEQADRLERLLDELAIKHLRRQKGFQLSGGERRRLEITRALVTEPKFMLLDEPFAGVDPIAVHDIQTIVAGLRHRGIGVLITDHNVEQTLDIVDRAYIMFEGKVQVAGTVRELVFDDRVANLYLGPTLTARLRARLTPAA